MIKIYCVAALLLIFQASFSQNTKDSGAAVTSADTGNRNGPIFTRAEKMPKIIGGIKAMEDTLTSNLSNEDFEPKKQSFRFRLTISEKGSVRACELVGRARNKILATKLEAILSGTPGMWEPAVQNGHIVKAVKVIKVDYDSGEFHVKELE